MSRLVFILICLTFVSCDDECVCDDYTPDEVNEIWEFLKKFPDGADDEGVLAGMLSPIVPCGNCIEYDRKKRTILPSTADQDTVDNGIHEDDKLPPQGAGCPIGFARIGFRCVNFDDVFK